LDDLGHQLLRMRSKGLIEI